jgi:hypothetical protein
VNGKQEIVSQNAAKKAKNVIRKDIVVFIFFLFLSFLLWYLNSLGKEIEAGFRFPVRYTNLPKERAIVEESSKMLNLYIKGSGYSIVKLRLTGTRMPVSIDISKVSYKRVQGSKGLNYFIITSGLVKSLSVQMRYGCEITSIKPDTLFFTLERETVKSLPEKKRSEE